jgi:uncharacterized membrane protein YfcA
MELVAADSATVVGLIAIGLAGGILGGFVRGGGAFVMVPGLMGLGSEGLTAVGSNLLHRLGRMATSARRRKALGRADLKLLLLLALPGLAGVEVGRGSAAFLRARLGRGATDLYISVVLIVFLGAVTHMLARDLWRSRYPMPVRRPSSVRGMIERLRPLHVPPMIRFPASGIVVSLWLVLGIGFVGGWFGGTVALGGFLTVPALIYLLGAPASTAIATDLALVLVVGTYAGLAFAARGWVDLRATLLLYVGSIPGFHLGMLGTRLMREMPIRIATCAVLGLVGFGRLLDLPVICSDAAWFDLGARGRLVFHTASNCVVLAAAVAVFALVAGIAIRAAWTRSAYSALGDEAGEED